MATQAGEFHKGFKGLLGGSLETLTRDPGGCRFVLMRFSVFQKVSKGF